MIYSVFSWRTGRYRYFKGPGEERGQRPQARVKVDDTTRGQQPEALLTILPSTAKPVSEGTVAKGRIAVRADQAATVHTRRFGVEGLGDSLKPPGGAPHTERKESPLTTAAIYVSVLLIARKAIPAIIDKVL